MNYDLESCLEFTQPGITKGEIQKILACAEGHHDGPEWVWLLSLKTGQLGLLIGGCDYTGWD